MSIKRHPHRVSSSIEISCFANKNRAKRKVKKGKKLQQTQCHRVCKRPNTGGGTRKTSHTTETENWSKTDSLPWWAPANELQYQTRSMIQAVINIYLNNLQIPQNLQHLQDRLPAKATGRWHVTISCHLIHHFQLQVWRHSPLPQQERLPCSIHVSVPLVCHQ